MQDIKLGKYRHSKSGRLYEVISIGTHSETLEKLVVYKGLYDDEKWGNNPIWIRPLDMFSQNILLDGKTVPRFEFIE